MNKGEEGFNQKLHNLITRERKDMFKEETRKVDEGCPNCGRTDYRKVHKNHFCSTKCRKEMKTKNDR